MSLPNAIVVATAMIAIVLAILGRFEISRATNGPTYVIDRWHADIKLCSSDECIPVKNF